MSSLINYLIVKETKDSAMAGVPINPLYVILYLMGNDSSLFMMKNRYGSLVSEVRYDSTKKKFFEIKKVNLVSNKKSRRSSYDLIHFYYYCVGPSICGQDWTNFYTELPPDIKHKFYNILGETFYV